MRTDEVMRREAMARAAIKESLKAGKDESSAELFAAHHLDELDGAYWQKQLGTSSPEPIQILDILELCSHWVADDDKGLDVFDFTLPDDVTDYVISVRFDELEKLEISRWKVRAARSMSALGRARPAAWPWVFLTWQHNMLALPTQVSRKRLFDVPIH